MGAGPAGGIRCGRLAGVADAVCVHVDHQEVVAPLGEVLADRREDSPLEIVRPNLDYPAILEKDRVGAKGQRVFEKLCRTHGEGSQTDPARELGVAPSRITQLKHRLSVCPARHGYNPPATRARAGSARHPTGG